MRKRNNNPFVTWLLVVLGCYVLFFTPIGGNLLSSFGAAFGAVTSLSSSLSQPSTQTRGCPYASLIQQDADAAGIPKEYFLRQIMRESSCNPNARGSEGEEGIAQFTPATARSVNLSDPFEPHSALLAASHLMASYQSQFGDYGKALAAYNAGPGRVQKASNRCGVTWLTCLSEDIKSRSTLDYVNSILYG